MNKPDVPVFSHSFTEPGFNQDPDPVLKQIQALGPVVYNDVIDRYMVTRYRDCALVLGNARMFDMHRSVDRVRALFGGDTMETIDLPSRHNAIRAIWATNFRADYLQDHRAMILEAVDQLLLPFAERVRAGETVDAVPALTRGIPTLVIAKLLGIDADMVPTFVEWSDAMGAQLEATLDRSPRTLALIETGQAATRELNTYLSEVVRCRRGSEGPDLISQMANAPYAISSMSEQEIVASATQLVFAGNETTAGVMATTMVTLAEFPDQRAAVAANPTLAEQTFEEVHRWRTLSQGGSQRFACSNDSRVAEVVIPMGAEVMAMTGIANRDPRRWDNPDDFDIFRPRKPHLGFGFGMHACLGVNLARLEGEIWLQRLLEELPDYQLAGRPQFGTNFIARKPVSVPICL